MADLSVKFAGVTLKNPVVTVSGTCGFGEEYADKVMSVMPMWSIVLVIAGIFLFALLGGLIGKALLKKHFVKAGIA